MATERLARRPIARAPPTSRSASCTNASPSIRRTIAQRGANGAPRRRSLRPRRRASSSKRRTSTNGSATPASALRDAAAAHAEVGDGLARLALERAEIESGAAARLADGLLALARSTEDRRERREAYERLADLDAAGRDDYASALLWHRTILEADPHHLPSLRNVEHALLTDGRLDDLEPVMTAIARALVAAGDTSAEVGAHAQLAARLRMRGAAGEWEPTREVAELAASLPEPSLWALRAMSAHARAANDEEALIRGVARARREDDPLARNRAARSARGRSRDAGGGSAEGARAPRARRDGGPGRRRELGTPRRGARSKPRTRAGPPRRASRSPARARSPTIGCWRGTMRRGFGSMTSATPIAGSAHSSRRPRSTSPSRISSVASSALYTQRGGRAELAALLERRLATATDGEDRVRLEVERAQALLSVGEPLAARRALESALETKSDHVGALSALRGPCARR